MAGTTSLDKVSRRMMWNQHLLVRQHALGNFRTLLQAITVDPAMLVYLDGAWSSADAPNENYAREVMELFGLGRLQYTEDDVRAGAKALAGWGVDWDSATATFYPWNALDAPVTYLGRSVMTASDVIDAVCDHAACPGWVAGKIYRLLVGVDPTNTRRTQLATIFRSNNLEIAPVVESILRGPEFLTARMNRPRFPVEFMTAAMAAGMKDDVDYSRWRCGDMGQVPFLPPNVAGWASGPKWLSPSLAIVRADVANNFDPVAAIVHATNPLAATLRQCSMHEVGAQTRNAFAVAAGAIFYPEARARTLLALAVSSPEFSLA